MKRALVITSIAHDTNEVLRNYAKECGERNIHYVVVGDVSSPSDFVIDKCDYYGIDSQLALPFELAKVIPTKHYARKNLGYLIAIKNGCTELQETDDDNKPYESFWEEKSVENVSLSFNNKGWLNVYSFFPTILFGQGDSL